MLRYILISVILASAASSADSDIYESDCAEILSQDEFLIVHDIVRTIYDAPIKQVRCQEVDVGSRVSVQFEDEVKDTYVLRKSVTLIKLYELFVESQRPLYMEQSVHGWYLFKDPLFVLEYRSFLILDRVVIARLFDGVTYEEAYRILSVLDKGDVPGFDKFGIASVDVASVRSIARSRYNNSCYEVWFSQPLSPGRGSTNGIILEGSGYEYEMVLAGCSSE